MSKRTKLETTYCNCIRCGIRLLFDEKHDGENPDIFCEKCGEVADCNRDIISLQAMLKIGKWDDTLRLYATNVLEESKGELENLKSISLKFMQDLGIDTQQAQMWQCIVDPNDYETIAKTVIHGYRMNEIVLTNRDEIRRKKTEGIPTYYLYESDEIIKSVIVYFEFLSMLHSKRFGNITPRFVGNFLVVFFFPSCMFLFLFILTFDLSLVLLG